MLRLLYGMGGLIVGFECIFFEYEFKIYLIRFIVYYFLKCVLKVFGYLFVVFLNWYFLLLFNE